MPTVTCHCGQRITVGPKAGRETVNCPACGETVPVNGAAAEPPALKFGVKVVGGPGESPPAAAAEERTIAFTCPGCGKEFVESRRAAGKPTRCPKCAAEFVIPAGPVGRVSNPSDSDSGSCAPNADGLETRPTVEAGVDAAVAAYTAGKRTGGKRRMITGRSMVPIGFCLILLGGGVSILGSVLMVKGFQNAFSASAIGGGLGGGAAGGLVGPMADYSKLLQELAGEANARRREPAPPQQPANPLPQANAEKTAKDYQKSLKEQEGKQSSGQTMLIGGVIAGGVGMLITFIGGIFLLAGLIGRFLQPRQVSLPSSSPSGEPGA